MQIWSPNGRNPGTRIFAACDAFKRGTQISEQIAFVECQNQNLKRERLLNAFIADAEDALAKPEKTSYA